MKITDVINGAKMFVERGFCQIKVHSPEILLVVGVCGGVVATVMACKATLKATKVKEELDHDLQMIKDVQADESISEDIYSEEDAVKDKIRVFTKSGVKLAGLYAGSVLVGCASIACVGLSFHMEANKAATAVAFGNTAVAGLMEYRAKMAEKYGKEAEEELYRGIKQEKLEESELYSDSEGKHDDVRRSVKSENCYNDYSIVIDEKCGIWDRSTDITMMSLHSSLRHLNDLLVARATDKRPGYLFLREVLEDLEVPRERWPKNASIVGWLYDKNDSSLQNYVEFGPMYLLSKNDAEKEGYYIVETYNESNENHPENRVILLEFNIDGIIENRL